MDRFERIGRGRISNGMKAQVGGGLAIFVGVMLLVFASVRTPGPGLDIHEMAKVFIGFGIFLLLAGTMGRVMAD
jgi:hypothetical protein